MSAQPPHEPPSPGSHYQPSLGVVLIILVLFVGGTFLMLRSSSASSPTTSTSTTTASTTQTTTKPSTTVVPKSRVRVQVANGTMTTGLARAYTQQLMTLGWDTLPQLNAAQTTATIVYYNPGYRWAAVQIAHQIKVASTAVRALNGQTPVPGAAADDVIVILGPDVAVKG
ncbi:MAG TPA: LytR C-terminal domain-containing protein [Acidimicrobiales bacterium]|nr:LytR C-terminal domain-containing protein [Acidimicrobiales bacterium]